MQIAHLLNPKTAERLNVGMHKRMMDQGVYRDAQLLMREDLAKMNAESKNRHIA